MHIRLTAPSLFVTTAIFVSACDSKEPQPVSAASTTSPSPAASLASTPPGTPSANAALHTGPVVPIPAGTLIAGSACGDHPRLPNVELPGTKLSMNAFDIDRYPFPNDPASKPTTGVTRAEAQKLCEARGRRLCTELEWERACKGPDNSRYEYGDKFDTNKCPPPVGNVAEGKAYPECKSPFGVELMHARHWEWTSSDWGRGGDEGLVTLRGSHGGTPYAAMRCANVKSSKPDASDDTVGFRCCGGPPNTASVSLPPPDPKPENIEAVTPIDEAVATRFGHALRNGGVNQEDGVAYELPRAWRWRPVDHEELFVVERTATPAQGSASSQVYVVQLCANRAILRAQLAGPVDSVGAPEAKDDAVVLAIKSGENTGEVAYRYQFGQVHTTQPDWLKPAAAVK